MSDADREVTEATEDGSMDDLSRIRMQLGDIYQAAKGMFDMFEALRVAGFTEQQALYLVAQFVTSSLQAEQS